MERSAKGKFTLRLTVWLVVFALLYASYSLLDGNGVCCAALFWPVMPVFVTQLVATDCALDPIARLLASRQLQWLGNISFEMFMVHLLAMRIAQHMTAPYGTTGCAAFVAMSLGMTVLMAWTLNVAFVRPISKLSKTITEK